MGQIEKFYSMRNSLAADVVKGRANIFKANVSRVQGFVGSLFETAKNGSTFVGLNYDSEKNIRRAIKEYVNGVQKTLLELNDKATNDQALRGDIAEAAKEYVAAVSKVASDYVSALLAYSDKMHEYVLDYQENAGKLSSDVRKEANSLSSESEAYTEKYQDA